MPHKFRLIATAAATAAIGDMLHIAVAVDFRHQVVGSGGYLRVQRRQQQQQ